MFQARAFRRHSSPPCHRARFKPSFLGVNKVLNRLLPASTGCWFRSLLLAVSCPCFVGLSSENLISHLSTRDIILLFLCDEMVMSNICQQNRFSWVRLILRTIR